MSSSPFEQTNVLVSSRAVPQRVLVVDDDESVLAGIATLLTGQFGDIERARTGQEAIALIGRQWIPLLVTDDDMPGMNGIALTHRLRALATKPTYVIMLTSTTDSRELERGYCAGVDQYVSKQNWQAALSSRVAEGFKAVRLRRMGRPRVAHESIVTVDLQSGAHTARHLVGRLSAEIDLARRTQGKVCVVALGIRPRHDYGQETVTDVHLSATLGALKGALRPQLDWVAWLHPVGGTQRFAAVLPSSLTDAAAFEQSMYNAFVSSDGGQAPLLTFGKASFDPQSDADPPTSLELLAKAECSRRALEDGSTGSATS